MSFNGTDNRWPCMSGSRREPHNGSRPMLHRIGEVMEQEGISIRSVARELRIPVSAVRAQLDPTCDLSISDLRSWQAKLKVPLADLLVDPESELSPSIMLRARLLKAMKSARSIQEHARQEQIQILALGLVEQLVHMMPELREVTPWPSVGQRRSREEQGRVAERCVPDELLEGC